MSTINSYFTEMLKSITPDQSRTDAAKKAAEDVRAHLKQYDDYPTCDPATLLSGSYKRHTAIIDIHDVDILVFPDIEEWESTPEEALSNLRRALADFPDSKTSIRSQTRSVRITLDKQSMDLDIVPALNHEPSNTVALRIPDKDAETWIDSMPLRYGDLLSSLNQGWDSKVLPTIRLLKAWRDESMIYKRPKSYWLEILVYDAFKTGSIHLDDGYPGILCDLFVYVANRLSVSVPYRVPPSITDPAMQTALKIDWPIEYWESFYDKVLSAKETALDAIDADSLDKQIAQWQQLFGSLWPDDDAVANSLKLSDSVIKGTACISSSGVLFASAIKGETLIPVKPVKAYGS
jgi:hypothetical protein